MDSASATLLKRLETVTARLEAVEKQIASGVSAAPSISSPAAVSGGDSSSSPSVAAYQELIDTFIVPLVAHTQKIGNDELKAQVEMVKNAINAQKSVLVCVSQCKKPEDSVFAKLMETTSKLVADANAIRDKNRPNKMFTHLSTLSEGINCLFWAGVPKTPAPYVNETRGSSEFYSNKLLTELKKTPNQDLLDWVHAWNNFMKELANYIKKFHTTGLVWNAGGSDASSFSASSSAAAPKAGGPPAPPPPPPANLHSESSKSAPVDTGALFAQINKGGDVTTGLKKVTKEMKTKNQEGRSGLITAEAAPKKTTSTSAPKAGPKKGTPKFELSGNKWVIEFQEGQNLTIDNPEVRQTVYMYKCEKTYVNVKGKVNSISIDNCKRSGMVFENAVASCETVNSSSIDIQCTGKVPSVSIDKCTGVQVYLSAKGLETEIVTSKSDSMNVLIPDPAGGPDPVETPIPEQYKTVIVNGKLKTNILEHV